MEKSPSTEVQPEATTRWALIRDIGVFQVKLFLDALRDVVLSPISLAAGIVDLLRGGERDVGLFDRVLSVGRRSDDWIGLFRRSGDEQKRDDDARSSQTVDSLLGDVERRVVERYEKGGLTASAKRAVDHSLDSLNRRGRR